MANVTLFIPDDLKKRMDQHKDIRWSSAIRTVIGEKLEALERTEALASGSRLTEEDVKILVKKVDASARKHAKALLNEDRN
ncbi:hypothetical protein KJ765_02165 [Candidatus Micrarchaeota archaeon]|nr:hypothetical protein [Candidatus Micrarchaeota archaeon]